MVLFGGIILAGLHGYARRSIGSETGMYQFDLLAQRSFGRRGSWLPSLMIGLTQIGWFKRGRCHVWFLRRKCFTFRLWFWF